MNDPTPRTVEQLVVHLDHLASCMRGELRNLPPQAPLWKQSPVLLRISPPDAEIIQQAANLLRLAMEPSVHLSKAGRDPRELRYSALDVEAMIDVVLALQRHKQSKGA